MYWLSPKTLKDKVPDRWRIFVKWCGSEAFAIEACSWGKGPLVQINSAKVRHANGRTTIGDNGEVVCFIHGKVANAYEKGDGWIIWESTVLHELMHWARWRQKLPQQRNGQKDDFGNDFEREAYGEDITLKTPWRAGP